MACASLREFPNDKDDRFETSRKQMLISVKQIACIGASASPGLGNFAQSKFASVHSI